jgi:mono/diheme cytochrome c family protein
LRIKASRPREIYWTAEQQKAFKIAARAAGRPSMALAVDIGAELGQREGDTIGCHGRNTRAALSPCASAKPDGWSPFLQPGSFYRDDSPVVGRIFRAS